MYKKTENQLTFSDDFFLPFGGKLNKENRWVVLADLIPWWKLEESYAKNFKKSNKGQDAFPVRLAFGSLYIQQRLGVSDRETVQQITENPYLQYFIGLPGFQDEPPFDHSLMTHFRKRLGSEVVNELNEWFVIEEQKQAQDDDTDDDDSNDPPAIQKTVADDQREPTSSQDSPNQGKLILDATCTPADIAFPTDLNLLNEAREKLEEMIDILHAPFRGNKPKPRTYRKKARRDYLAIAKQRRVGGKKIRKAVSKQLNYVKRNLESISRLAEQSDLTLLSKAQYNQLLVIQELYRQQQEMYENRKHQIDDRIVSISQPHVRPIVRGKAKARVEFGAKVAISVVNSYSLIEQLEWDNYNEGVTLQESVEAYKDRFGYYPTAVLADKIYRNRENLQYCKERNIRLSGPKLGRPSKNGQTEDKRLAYQDACERNAVEGKFGEGKRHYGLGLIQTRLQETSETTIALQFLIMNFERKLRVLIWIILRNLFGTAWTSRLAEN